MAQLRIATRRSDLALWQARYVAARLQALDCTCTTTLVEVDSEGDLDRQTALDQTDGTGYFTAAVEQALLRDEADIAVHSYKDLPTALHPALHIAGVPARAPVEDVLVMHRNSVRDDVPLGLKPGAIVGTSSARRKGLLGHQRTDLKFVDLRGNVPTRLQAVRDGRIDATLLALAGLSRLDLFQDDETLLMRPIDVAALPPAPSQGALAVQCRVDDTALTDRLGALTCADTLEAVTAERSLLSRFGGGCHLPLGIYVRRIEVVGRATWALDAAFAKTGQQVQSWQERGENLPALIEKAYAALA